MRWLICLEDRVRFFSLISVYDFWSSVSLYIDSDEADKQEKVTLLYQILPHQMYTSKCLNRNALVVHFYFVSLQLLLCVFVYPNNNIFPPYRKTSKEEQSTAMEEWYWTRLQFWYHGWAFRIDDAPIHLDG